MKSIELLVSEIFKEKIMKEYKKEDPMPLVSDKTKLNIVLIVIIVFVGRFLYNQFTVEIPRSRISKMLRNTDYIVSEETGVCSKQNKYWTLKRPTKYWKNLKMQLKILIYL